MLVLKRKLQEKIIIHHMGESIEIWPYNIDRNYVRLAFEGPESFHVIRPDAKNKNPRPEADDGR